MTNTPLKNYGFIHNYDGKDHSFAVAASTAAEAQARIASMSRARLVGEMHAASVINPSPECPVWTLPPGSLLHIGGMPYFTTTQTVVEGYGDPLERLKDLPKTGAQEGNRAILA